MRLASTLTMITPEACAMRRVTWEVLIGKGVSRFAGLCFAGRIKA